MLPKDPSDYVRGEHEETEDAAMLKASRQEPKQAHQTTVIKLPKPLEPYVRPDGIEDTQLHANIYHRREALLHAELVYALAKLCGGGEGFAIGVHSQKEGESLRETQFTLVTFRAWQGEWDSRVGLLFQFKFMANGDVEIGVANETSHARPQMKRVLMDTYAAYLDRARLRWIDGIALVLDLRHAFIEEHVREISAGLDEVLALRERYGLPTP